MEGSISYNDLGVLILFLLFLLAGSYFLITLKKANLLIREFSSILKANRDQIDNTVYNLHLTTEKTAADISPKGEKYIKQISKAIDVISPDTTETILTIDKNCG